MSSAATAELLLQTLSARVQGVACHVVSGYRCCSDGSREAGAVARVWCRAPDCTRCRMPEEMDMVARRPEWDSWAARNAVAGSGSSFDEKEPGMKRRSNCGALANEFCSAVSVP